MGSLAEGRWLVHVRTKHGVVVLTTHALARFRGRVKAGASSAEIAEAVAAARLETVPPSWVRTDPNGRDAVIGYLVGQGWACPLRGAGERDTNAVDYVALTTIKRRRPAKADVRQWREQAAEDRAA